MNNIIKVFTLMILCIIIFFFKIRNQDWFSNINAHLLIKKYSQEEIEHFAKFAFQDGEIKKWKSNIRYLNSELQTLDTTVQFSVYKCIIRLNQLLEEIKIQEVIRKPNLEIRVKDSLNNRFGEASANINPLKIPYPTINKGKISIIVVKRTSGEINSTLIHEFTHILGFNHNYPMEEQSIFNPSPITITFNNKGKIFTKPTFETYTGLDSSAIRIMYDADVAIDPGLTKLKFYRKIEEAKLEIGSDTSTN